jgi:phosphoribosylformylglycinamidine cyclo-ligase
LLLDKHKIPLECFIPDLGCTLAEELLRPTVIYTSHVKILKEAGGLKSMAHITGGGIPGNADRNIPQDKSILIHTEKWTTPPIFKYIQEHGVSKEEMMQTFNMGLGFIAVVEPERISTIMEKLNKAGLVAFEIGEIVSRENQKQGVILQP